MRFPIVLLLIFYTSVSFAGNLIRYKVSGVPNVAGGQQVFYAEGDRIRQAVSGHLYYLYDGATDSLQLVDTSKRAYYPMSRTFFKDVSKTVSAQEQRIKDMLAKGDKLPEQARLSLQQALNSMELLKKSSAALEQKNNPSVKLEGPVGKASYNGVNCNKYQVVVGSSKADVCYAGFEQLGLSRQMVKTFNNFQRFLTHISGFNSMFALLDNYMPLRVDIQEPIKGVIEFSSASPKSMGPEALELPAGFQRISVKNPLNIQNN